MFSSNLSDGVKKKKSINCKALFPQVDEILWMFLVLPNIKGMEDGE